MSTAGTVLLAALAVGLAATLGLELQRRRPDPDRGVSRPPATEQATPAAAPGADRTDQWVETILARPLFAPDRRPEAGPAARPVAAIPLPRVTGILVNGGSRRVIFEAAADGRPTIAGEGSDVNGFRVQSIEPNRVVVVGPDGSRNLQPSFDPKPPPPPAPPAPSGLPPAAPGPVPGLPSLVSIPGLPLAPSVTAR